MSGTPVDFQRQGSIARIRFNRPHVLNALDLASSDALLDACRSLADDGSNRVVVISGAGRAFMAGGDIGDFVGSESDRLTKINRLITTLHEAIEILTSLRRPVLASLHGAVAGAGVSIALAADLAIAADNTVFNLAYSKLGASPDGSSSWSLPRVVGLRKAMEIAMLSDTIDAQEALRLGLVNRVVPLAALSEETDKLAKRLADGPTFAYGQIKRLLRTSLERTLPDQLQAEALSFSACATTNDFVEGVSAFLEKRAAKFEGKA